MWSLDKKISQTVSHMGQTGQARVSWSKLRQSVASSRQERPCTYVRYGVCMMIWAKSLPRAGGLQYIGTEHSLNINEHRVYNKARVFPIVQKSEFGSSE